jgi:hypothetical protein
MTDPLRCPTCRAAWRSAAACPRCGTDVAPLMRVAVRAWQLREDARRALGAGDRAADALALAQAACRLHATTRGRRLLLLALVAAGHTAEAAALLAHVTEAAPSGC